MAEAAKNYLDAATLDRVKQLDVRARLVVEGYIAGHHRSPYHGQAVEFATHREYAPGDDLRHIDWKVWSRSDRLYIKEYVEETNLQCTIVVDASRSMQYGGGWRKYDYAATAAASLAFLLQRQQDAVGLAIFNDRVEKVLPPSVNRSHLNLLIHELERAEPARGTDTAAVFGELAGKIPQRGIVVLISDLFVPQAALGNALKQLRRGRNEVIVFQVLHADELTFPFRAETVFRGLEDGVELRAEPRALRKCYVAAMERFLSGVKGTCAAAGADHVLMRTDQHLDAALGGYLAFRQRVRRSVRH